MQHRHINTSEWTAAAVDSVLERGDLPDWRELFAAVHQNPEIAKLVLRVATEHDLGGASILAKTLVERIGKESASPNQDG
jgi:hypothetical protein